VLFNSRRRGWRSNPAPKLSESTASPLHLPLYAPRLWPRPSCPSTPRVRSALHLLRISVAFPSELSCASGRSSPNLFLTFLFQLPSFPLPTLAATFLHLSAAISPAFSSDRRLPSLPYLLGPTRSTCLASFPLAFTCLPQLSFLPILH
jgi:hypothetical protein